MILYKNHRRLNSRSAVYPSFKYKKEKSYLLLFFYTCYLFIFDFSSSSGFSSVFASLLNESDNLEIAWKSIFPVMLIMVSLLSSSKPIKIMS